MRHIITELFDRSTSIEQNCLPWFATAYICTRLLRVGRIRLFRNRLAVTRSTTTTCCTASVFGVGRLLDLIRGPVHGTAEVVLQWREVLFAVSGRWHSWRVLGFVVGLDDSGG